MFLGRGKESKKLYLAHKGKAVSEQDSRLWERVIADDFTEFRKVGLTHPMMAEIEKRLGVSRWSRSSDSSAVNALRLPPDRRLAFCFIVGEGGNRANAFIPFLDRCTWQKGTLISDGHAPALLRNPACDRV
jgi:hypothetical protein